MWNRPIDKETQIPAIQYPIFKSYFSKDILGGCIFNPAFIQGRADLWLGYYVNKIYKYNCPLTSSYNMSSQNHVSLKHDNIANLFDHLYLLYLLDSDTTNYLDNNISLDFFKRAVPVIINDHFVDISPEDLYDKFSSRFNLKELYKQPIVNKTVDISFIITSNREYDDCHLQQIIDTIESFNYDSYEIIIFSNKYNYVGKKVTCISEEDFGQFHTFNICYQYSRGKNIVVLTDYSIPNPNILSFTSTDEEIRTLVNK